VRYPAPLSELGVGDLVVGRPVVARGPSSDAPYRVMVLWDEDGTRISLPVFEFPIAFRFAHHLARMHAAGVDVDTAYQQVTPW